MTFVAGLGGSTVGRLLAACALATAPLIAQAASLRLVGFYAPWDGESVRSLQQHAAELDVVVPATISVTGPGHEISIEPDAAGHSAMASLRHRPKLWLMVQNARLGAWDGPGAAALLDDQAASAGLLDRLQAEIAREQAAGLVVDFEDLPASAQPDLLSFLTSAKARFQAHHWTLAVAAPPADPNWDLHAIGLVTDHVILMGYGEHWQTGPPGPLASIPWFTSVVERAMSALPKGSAIIALASYAYDWPEGGVASILSIRQATTLATQTRATVTQDSEAGAAHFEYSVNGVAHVVWMSDAASFRRQMAIAREAGAERFALWRLGTEDSAIWGR